MEMQGLGLGKALQSGRSRYHLTLGQLLDFLGKVDESLVVEFDVGKSPAKPHSYRGYYEDLAIQESPFQVTVKEFFGEMMKTLGAPFQGYKGGEYVMGADTPLWKGDYGTTLHSRAIMGVSKKDGKIILETKEVDS